MSVQRIASRYAKSLIDLAQETNKLERIKEDIDAFKSALESRDFFLLLKSPIVPTSKKASIMKVLFDGKFDELTMAFINLLIQKKREPHLPAVAAEFHEQYKVLKQITSLKITTAKQLSEEALNAIKVEFLASTATDKNIEIETAIDPNLIGGFVVEFGDRLYDASIKHKLGLLKKEFVDNKYTSQVIAR